eukprot:gene28461-31609_t
MSAQLGESVRMNAELRGQINMMGDELQRAAADRSAASMAVERLTRQFQEGTTMLAEEGRRAVEEANNAFRAESQRRQQQHLADISILNREVDAYRLQTEAAQLDQLRSETSAIASSEAQQLGNLRGQIGELQTLLNGMGQQLQSEQAFDFNLKTMEGQMREAQDLVVQRTVSLMESKASQFMKLISDLEGLTADRDEETRTAGEQAMTAVVRTHAKKERAGLERLLVLESALRDVATASAQSLVDLQNQLDYGMSELAMMSESAKHHSEDREAALREQDREAALREQVNAALTKIRAYARDMEESLDQERLKLEEVVKMEIKARIQSSEAIKQEAATQLVGMRGELKAQADAIQHDIQKLQDDLHYRVVKEMREEIDEKLAVVGKNITVVQSHLEDEEKTRKQSRSLGLVLVRLVASRLVSSGLVGLVVVCWSSSGLVWSWSGLVWSGLVWSVWSVWSRRVSSGLVWSGLVLVLVCVSSWSGLSRLVSSGLVSSASRLVLVGSLLVSSASVLSVSVCSLWISSVWSGLVWSRWSWSRLVWSLSFPGSSSGLVSSGLSGLVWSVWLVWSSSRPSGLVPSGLVWSRLVSVCRGLVWSLSSFIRLFFSSGLVRSGMVGSGLVGLVWAGLSGPRLVWFSSRLGLVWSSSPSGLCPSSLLFLLFSRSGWSGLSGLGLVWSGLVRSRLVLVSSGPGSLLVWSGLVWSVYVSVLVSASVCVSSCLVWSFWIWSVLSGRGLVWSGMVF